MPRDEQGGSANEPAYARREMHPTAATPVLVTPVLRLFPLRVTLKKIEFPIPVPPRQSRKPADLGTPLELVMSQIAAPEWLVRLSDLNTSLMN
jgi:hypothetical protein